MSNKNYSTAGQKTEAAKVERILRRIWVKCTESEENEKFFGDLLDNEVGVPSDEEFLKTEEGRRKAGGVGQKGRKELLVILTKGKLEDCRKGGTKLRKQRGKLRKRLRELVSERQYKNVCSKVKKHCAHVRVGVKKEKADKLKHLVNKYGNSGKAKTIVPEELAEFKKCKVFSSDMSANVDEGVEVVLRDGEVIKLSECEKAILARGPGYCLIKTVKREEFCCCLETAIVKHKWQCLNDDETEEGEEEIPLSDEEQRESERVAALAEEMAAESRTPYDDKERTFDLRKQKVTDYKKNSRVIFPRAQSAENESKLEVLRVELQNEHDEWVKTHCDCKSKQLPNLTKDEIAGLKSIRLRLVNGELVVLPTDKSGRFALMTMATYIKAGEVHIKEDKEMTVNDLRKNQKQLNGHVSMILKVFGAGANWEHQQRLRESMIHEGISVCPLWLLYKCHKGWTSDSGKVPPTRPVAGGNAGMNFPLSELVSWVLEPLASAMEGSSELVSGEDLKSNIDQLNVSNKNWVPEASITTSVIDMEGAVESEDIPKLCECDQGKCELYEEEEDDNQDKTSDENIPAGWKEGSVPTSNDNVPAGWKQENGNSDENIPSGWKQEAVPTRDDNIPAGWKSGEVKDNDREQDISRLCEEQKDLSESLPRCSEPSKPSSRESKAQRMRARRAAFTEARKIRICRKQPPVEVKMMRSCEVPSSLIQDKSIPMVIIGTDVVSLYPNLRWEPAGQQIYQAIMESDIKFEGLNYKEGVRYLALVRGYDWCRANKLRRVMPERRFAKGSWPGITGAGPLGPSVDG